MANKPAGYYSVEAIQGRQQAVVDEYNRVKAQEKPKDKPQEAKPPIASFNPQNALPPVTRPKTSPTTPARPVTPDLAEGVDKYGMPYFGEGIKGWIRKTFSYVFDPKNFNVDKDVQAEYDKKVDPFADKINSLTNWDSWGENVFGLSAQDVSQATMKVASIGADIARKEATGELSTLEAVGEGTQTALAATQRFALGNLQGAGVLMGGLQLLGLDDVVVRNVVATGLATEALGANAPIEKGNIQEILEYTLFGKDVAGLITNFRNGKISTDDIKETYKSYWEGSQAVYTMATNQMIQDEFNRRVQNGEDAGLVAQDLGNPWVELGGSFLLSPSTYLGAGVPERVGKFLNLAPETGKAFYFFGKTVQRYRIPTFGQLMKIPVGTVKMSQTANRLDDLSHIKGMDNAIESFSKASTETAARKVLDDVATAVTKAIKGAEKRADGMATDYGLISYVNHSKVSTTVRQTRTVLDVILKDAESVDDAIGIFSDMAKLAKNPEDKTIIARLLKAGKVPFTQDGLFTGQLLARMDSVVSPMMETLLKSKNINKNAVVDDLLKGIERVTDELVPSIEDMVDARKAVKAGKFTEEEARLAKLYDKVPAHVKATTKIGKYTEPARKLGVNIMSQVFMNASGGYFNRNILGQSVNIIPELGLDAAIEISAQSYKGIDGVVGSSKWTQTVLDINNKKLEKLIGFVPEGALRSIGNIAGDAGQEGGKIGFLNAAQHAEAIAASEIVLRSARNEVMKAVPAAIKGSGWDEVAANLPKEQTTLLYKLLMDNVGNLDDTIAEFRNIVGKGEIEAWRLTPIPEGLMKTLDDLKQGDAIKSLMRTAKTQDEFTAGISKILDNIDAKAKNVFLEMQSVGGASDDAVKNLITDSYDFFGDGDELFRRKIMYWENARVQIKNAVGRARDVLNRKIKNRPELVQLWEQSVKKLEAVQNTENNVYKVFSDVRDDVVKLYKDNRTPIPELVDSAVNGKWSLRAEFPDVDWNTITRQDFNDKLWKSYNNFSNRYWRDWNIAFFDDQMQELENFSQIAFQQGLDAAVSTNKGADNPFRLAFEYRNIAQKMENVKPEDIKDVVELAQKYGVKNNGIINTVKKYTGKVFNSVEEIPTTVAREAFEAQRLKKGLPDPFLPFPAAYNGEQPTMARALWESAPNIRKDLEQVRDVVLDDWGKKVKTLDAGADDVIGKFAKTFKNNMKTVHTKAGLFATELRDYILHDYEKTNLDLAMSYLMPFQYWTTRTYAKWMERFVENPKYINLYFKYKETLQKEHSELPEWWRYNAKIPTLPGINNDPIFFNLEATLNPLYSLFGTDFNDPYKRVDWLSSMVDDMNKAGPTLAPVYSWAVATYLYAKGEEDAATRWMGRLLPQTALVKTLLTRMGADLNVGPLVRDNEFDPFVNFLMDGLDPYERNRVARNLAGLVNQEVMINGELVRVTEEMAIQASADQDGELWDYAIKNALNERAAGQTFSFLFGVGFKSRNEGDLKVDQFYGEYHALLSMRTMMSPEEYTDQWARLREKYPEMDVLLIGKKAGKDREAALAYNVLSRIPPGELNDIAETLGVKPYMLEQFYSNKGDLSGMTPQDRDRFMAAIVDMSAMLKMPDYATRAEWNLAKQTYKDVNNLIVETYGEDINDKIGMFYDLPENERDAFMQAYPEVSAAMEMKTAYIANTPILAAYFGGLNTVERYYMNQMDMQLEEEFGEDMSLLMEEYYALKNNLQDSEAKAFYNANNLKAYEKRKKELLTEYDALIIESGKLLPEGKGYEVRPEFQPQGGYQEEALSYATGDPQAEAAQAIWDGLTPAAQELVTQYFETGEKLPSAVTRQLNYLAEQQGISQYDALRLLGIEAP